MTAKDVLKLAKEKGVKIVDLRFIDLPGLWQHFSIPVSELSEGIFEDGLGFDGSSIRGFQTIDESDMLLIPDPTHGPDGSVHRGAHAGADLQRQGSGHRQVVHPRPPLHRPEGRGLRQEERRRGHDLHRPRAGVLLLRLHPLRPELPLRLLLHRLGGGRLEQRQGGHARPAEPRLQAALQAGLLPGAADGPVPGHPVGHGAGPGVGRRAGRGAPPRGGHRRPDRDRHALRHADEDGRQGPLVQVLREEHRPEVGQDRDLHAQAAVPGQRLRHAHPPVAVEERQEPLLRAGRLRRHLARCASTTSAASSSTRRRCWP